MQFPFFFVATYAFWKGGCRWIRLPAALYGSHVATTLVAILYHFAVYDFKSSPHAGPLTSSKPGDDTIYTHPGPETTSERLRLAAVYLPYFIIPVLLVLRMAFSSEYAPVSADDKE